METVLKAVFVAFLLGWGANMAGMTVDPKVERTEKTVASVMFFVVMTLAVLLIWAWK